MATGFISPMICDLDIWQAANDLIHRYGNWATVRASARADDCLIKGDHQSYSTWREILRVIVELQLFSQRTRPNPAHAPQDTQHLNTVLENLRTHPSQRRLNGSPAAVDARGQSIACYGPVP